MKLMLGVCTRGNDLYYKLIDWLLPYVHEPLGPTEIVLQPSPYSAAHGQEKLFKYAVEKDVDYLLVLDADIGPPPGSLEKLLAHDKDIVVAPIWFFDQTNSDIHLNISRTGDLSIKGRAYKLGSGLERVHSAAFGFMLVSKKVLKAFSGAKESFTEWSPMLAEWYKKTFSDSIFFAKARVLGLEVYVDWSIDNVVHNRCIELCNKTVDNIVKKGAPDGVIEASVEGTIPVPIHV